MSFAGHDDLSAVVADFGSAFSKVGIAGTDCPVALFPTPYMQILGQSLLEAPSAGPSTSAAKGRRYGKSERLTFDFISQQEAVALKSPLVDGLVEDWDMMEAVLDYSISERLKMQSSSAERDVSLAGHPFLLCDHLNSSKADRERWCQLLFEKYQVAGVFMSKAGVLALYANARTTGLAIDMGANSTTITPVQDGFPLMMGARVHPVGGRALDQAVNDALVASGYSIRAGVEFGIATSGSMMVDTSVDGSGSNLHSSVVEFRTLECARAIKESVCVVRETPAIDNVSESFYELPDGSKISVGTVKYAAPELIFNASALASRMPGIQPLQNVLVSSAMGCEPEARRDIIGNIVVTGGASCIPGMNDRISAELAPIAPVGTRPKIAAASSEERKLGPWLGGSILGSLGTFHDLWFSAAEYKEHGAKMLHRKCP